MGPSLALFPQWGCALVVARVPTCGSFVPKANKNGVKRVLDLDKSHVSPAGVPRGKSVMRFDLPASAASTGKRLLSRKEKVGTKVQKGHNSGGARATRRRWRVPRGRPGRAGSFPRLQRRRCESEYRES